MEIVKYIPHSQIMRMTPKEKRIWLTTKEGTYFSTEDIIPDANGLNGLFVKFSKRDDKLLGAVIEFKRNQRKLTTYNNGAEASFLNRRVLLTQDYPNGPYVLTFSNHEADAEKPAGSTHCIKGKIRKTQISLSDEAMAAVVTAYMAWKKDPRSVMTVEEIDKYNNPSDSEEVK